MTTTSSLDRYDETERRLRLELAAAYRIFSHLGWTDLIFNHITVRVPGPERHYLINPFGLHYDEVTASNLVKLDLDGNKVEDGPYPANRAGFVVHGSVHRHREDAHCVMHTHTREGVAVACKKEGLSHDTFYGAQLNEMVAYHGFEGLTVREEEQVRIVANLGTKNLLILRNHGLLALGADIPDCFWSLWALQRACEAQVDKDALRGEDQLLPPDVREATRRGRDESLIDSSLGRTMFEALKRQVERQLTPATDYRI